MSPTRFLTTRLAPALLLLAAPVLAQHTSFDADSKPAWTPPFKSADPHAEQPQPGPATHGTARSDAPALPALQPPTSLAGLLLFDEPGDGSLWVLGGESYKARFAAEGTTYIPRFAPDAPRNFPIELRLAEVRLGARQLEFAPDVAPLRRDSSVSYDRGSLVESYRATPETIEQIFHFERLPAGGDLSLRIAFATELEAREVDGGLEFANEHGLVHCTRAVAIDAVGRRLDLATTLEHDAIRIEVPAEFLAVASFPLTIDPVYTATFLASDSSTAGSNLDIAYDGSTDRYCIVWQRPFSATDQDVFCQLFDFDMDAVPASHIAIDFTSASWEQPRVASNHAASQFLVVCQTSSNGASPYTIRGRTRPASSAVLGAPFEISTGASGDKLRPDVGGDPFGVPPTHYCVVWERRLNDQDHDIHYQLVGSTGALVYPTAQVVDNSPGTLDRYVAISKSNGRSPSQSQRWNVVWERNFAPGDGDIHGAQIRWDGALVTSTFPIDVSIQNDRAPQVSSPLSGGATEREYCVVFERHTAGGVRLQAQAMRGYTPVTPSTNLSALQGDPTTASQLRPSIDSDGNVFAVLYAEQSPGSPIPMTFLLSTFDLSGASSALVPLETRVPSTQGAYTPGTTRITSKQSGHPGAPSQATRFAGVYHYLSAGIPVRNVAVLYNALSPPGTPFCFGNGAPSQCPCGNTSSADRGCRNSTGAGCRLSGIGTNRLSMNHFALQADQSLPGMAGMFFQGYQATASGNGILYGDGRLCTSGLVVRLQVVLANGVGTAHSNFSIPTTTGVSPGDRRFYQYWYRDTQGECGSGFNMSNGYEVSWIW